MLYMTVLQIFLVFSWLQIVPLPSMTLITQWKITNSSVSSENRTPPPPSFHALQLVKLNQAVLLAAKLGQVLVQ